MDQDHPFVRHIYGEKDPPKKRVLYEFAEGAELHIQGNAWIYSLSYELSDNLRKRMKETFDADACVRINDLEAFGKALGRNELFRGHEIGAAYVRYISRNVTAPFDGLSIFEKDTRFRWQKELRIAAWGKAVPDAGKVIQIPGISSLLRRMF